MMNLIMSAGSYGELGFEIRHVASACSAGAALRASRQPSMIDAWLSSSDTIAVPSTAIVGMRPVLAAQHETYVSEFSVPKNDAIRSSKLAVNIQRAADEADAAVPAPYCFSPRCRLHDLRIVG